jgi:hypothetical protein
LENVRWILAAALSAYACHLAVHHTTPIDLALPFLAVVVTFLAWLAYPALMLGVPMLILAEIALPHEPQRLLAFGAIMATTFAITLARHTERGAGVPFRLPAGGVLETIAAIMLLRWIPAENVLIGRELIILLVSVGTVVVLGRTPFAVLVAVLTAFMTPAIPLRTVAVPVVMLFIAAFFRMAVPKLHLTWPSAVAVAFLILFFPWSGIVARAFPYFLRRATPERHRTLIHQALAPNRSMTYDVPDGAKTLVVSGANVAHMRRGELLGRIEPGAIDVRIGDVSDWGYLRREAWHHAHNPLPRDSAGKIRDYGYAAWVDGAGRIPLPRGVRTIRVTAAASIPVDASLQVEGFEFE